MINNCEIFFTFFVVPVVLIASGATILTMFHDIPEFLLTLSIGLLLVLAVINTLNMLMFVNYVCDLCPPAIDPRVTDEGGKIKPTGGATTDPQKGSETQAAALGDKGCREGQNSHP